MLTQKVLNYNRLLAQCVISLNALSVREMHHHMERDNFNLYIGLTRNNRHPSNRHTHLQGKQFRRARGRKNIPIQMPDFREELSNGERSPAEIRVAMLRKGVNLSKDVASREWSEQQLTMHSFYGVLDAFIPPKDALPWIPSLGDFKSDVKSKGLEVKNRVMNKWHSYSNGTRKIKKKEGFKNFSTKAFVHEAERIYVEAYKALADRNKDQLLDLITEFAYEKMWPDVERGSLVWEHCEFKSPSKVLNVRCADYPYKSGNDIAQVVVRMHSVQKYALYDRYGRLLLGSPTEPKEAVEYVVFENHIAREGSVWRLTDKIYPEWADKKSGVERPKLIDNLDKEQLPEKAVPIVQGWNSKLKRDEEKYNAEELANKGEAKKSA
ncbi:putative 39S ribosomal protein L45, mitochondrial [Aphelenchoides bicaudatus]|nr:putative 39S ribosomal protein L45, mitochondrial [Aphelenchoides bicaudatus]